MQLSRRITLTAAHRFKHLLVVKLLRERHYKNTALTHEYVSSLNQLETLYKLDKTTYWDTFHFYLWSSCHAITFLSPLVCPRYHRHLPDYRGWISLLLTCSISSCLVWCRCHQFSIICDFRLVSSGGHTHVTLGEHYGQLKPSPIVHMSDIALKTILYNTRRKAG